MAGVLENRQELEFSDRPVPPDQRMGKLSLSMAWWSVCSAMFYLVIAASLALAYGARNAIIGLVLSVVTYAAVNAVLVRHAIRTGLSVALFSRVLLGRSGASVATLIFFATAIYYAVFEGSVIAVALREYAGLSYPVAALVVVVYSVALIFGSIQNWLDRFNGVLLPFYLLGLGAAVVLAVAEYGYSDAWLDLGPSQGASSGGWWDCFVAYMGVWILMMFTFDYARFGRPEDARFHALISFGAPFYAVAFLLNGLVGIFLAASLPTEGAVSEVSVVFALVQLMGLAGLAFVWISQTRINTANYYLAAVNMESFARTVFRLRFPKWVWACVVGAITYVLMLADVFSYILQALAYQGIFVVAWVGIALVHIAMERPSRQAEPDPDRAVNPAGLVAWLLAAGAGLALHLAGGAVASFSAPVTFLVAASAYAALSTRASTQRALP
ncbi:MULTISPECIES: purine-cytosine permease family protein [unclassified Paracoccus (in: a-proteobacteria)]|uniref:purine-cytosine permease family protein n=1 Tax=unclassified Paracoccus (in: a-proteobacteria) TaxID=2688777 RepID=UPI0012B2D074|nr:MULTISPECIES: allantoin permease [unclassified Paracoccus (in: a-proteobacteria)]UXU74113.1 allantoin permease [Paracoccus sp. SMMA_5]UXU80002.1 allantoin permease [Paracoccus sp. SMMA_5_TC]